jgi:hypothetical protein
VEQALRVFLEADGALRSSPQWHCLKPPTLTPLQATNRLLRTLGAMTCCYIPPTDASISMHSLC